MLVKADGSKDFDSLLEFTALVSACQNLSHKRVGTRGPQGLLYGAVLLLAIIRRLLKYQSVDLSNLLGREGVFYSMAQTSSAEFLQHPVEWSPSDNLNSAETAYSRSLNSSRKIKNGMC